MGEVYLAYDERLSRQVAIKLLKTTVLSTEIDRKRFLQESKLCAQIKHANVIKVIDAFFHEECPCFAMEYIEGHSLRSYLNNQKGPEVTIPVIIDSLDAINSAHQISIIHRDLKPSNIFITSDEIVKVGDWGIATATNDPTGMTETGMILGTPEYMGPERITEGASLPQGDIYSMGCILYEALCGRPPFIGNLGQVITSQLKTIPETPQGIDKELSDFVLRLLQKDAKLRPANALKVRNELEAIYDRIMTEGGGSFSAQVVTKKQRKIKQTDTTKKNIPRHSPTKRALPEKIPINRGNTKLVVSILFILVLCSATIAPRFFQRNNVADDTHSLDLKIFIKRVSIPDFKTVTIQYDSTIKGSYPFKIIEQSELKTLKSGVIRFSDKLTPNGRTSNSQIALNKPCYKRLAIEIGSEPMVTLPVDMVKAYEQNFKPLSALSKEAQVSMYKSLEYLGGTKTPSKTEIMKVLDGQNLTLPVLDKLETIVPRYLDYLNYSENLYHPDSEVLGPLRGISSFLAQHSIHPVFGLTSKMMGFEFAHRRNLQIIEGWTTLCERSLRIERNNGKKHYPVLFYKFDGMTNKDALVASSESTSKIMNIAFTDKGRHHIDDFSEVFKLSMTTINLPDSIQWPPKEARLDVLFQGYGRNNYFSVSVNGNKRVKVCSTWDFNIYLGERTTASIPIPPSWLNKETNVIEFFSERLTEKLKNDLMQTTLRDARIRGIFTQ